MTPRSNIAAPLFTALALLVVLGVTLGLAGCAVTPDYLDKSAAQAEQERGLSASQQDLMKWLKWQAYHCAKVGTLNFVTATSTAVCKGSLNGEPVREIWQTKYPGTLQ